MIYNFQCDDRHLRDILLRTISDFYATEPPEWTVAQDLDVLAAKEKRNWVYEGVDCLRSQQNLYAINLCDGNEDAMTLQTQDLSYAYLGFEPGRRTH